MAEKRYGVAISSGTLSSILRFVSFSVLSQWRRLQWWWERENLLWTRNCPQMVVVMIAPVIACAVKIQEVKHRRAPNKIQNKYRRWFYHIIFVAMKSISAGCFVFFMHTLWPSVRSLKLMLPHKWLARQRNISSHHVILPAFGASVWIFATIFRG